MEITLLTVVSAGCGRLLLAGWEIPALLSVPQINRNGAFQSAEQAKKATPSANRIPSNRVPRALLLGTTNRASPAGPALSCVLA